MTYHLVDPARYWVVPRVRLYLGCLLVFLGGCLGTHLVYAHRVDLLVAHVDECYALAQDRLQGVDQALIACNRLGDRAAQLVRDTYLQCTRVCPKRVGLLQDLQRHQWSLGGDPEKEVAP